MRTVSSLRRIRNKQWLVPATCAISVSSWVLQEARVHAQNPAVAPPAAAGATQPARPSAVPSYINVLILAMDDLRLPQATPTPTARPVANPAPLPPVAPVQPPVEGPAAPAEVPLEPAELPPAPADIVPAPVQPGGQPEGETRILPPIDQVEPPAITPASVQRPALKPEYRINAKKRKKPDPNDKLFQLEPLENITFPKRTPQPTDAAPPVSATPPGSTTSPAPQPNLPIPQPGSATPVRAIDLLPSRPLGLAQQAAAPLRKALVAAGVADVMNSAPDDVFFQQFINSRRLSQRVFEDIQAATAKTVARLQSTPAPSPDAPTAPESNPNSDVAKTLPAVVRSASRIGLATGYRTVVVLAVVPPAAEVPLSPTPISNQATYAMVIVDTARETGSIIAFDEPGDDAEARNQSAAGTGAALLQRELQTWPVVTPAERAAQIERHMEAANASADLGDTETAEDELNTVLGINPGSTEALVMLGDMLMESDPDGASNAYRRAVDVAVTQVGNGPLLEKLTVAYTKSSDPNWARLAWDWGKEALKVKHDTATLRLAMATAQFQRAGLFRAHTPPHIAQAEDAERDARNHLDRALELEPSNRVVTTTANRLMAKYMIDQKRYREAIQALDLLAREMPDDTQIQQHYAIALTQDGRRMEDAFAAWSRVWRLNKVAEAPQSEPDYKRLAGGFDQRVFSIGKTAMQLTEGVAAGTLPRETALLQIERFQDNMEEAADAIKIMRPPATRLNSDLYLTRVYAADEMQQALEFYRMYLETGQEINRTRGLDLHIQAVKRLNAARAVRS